MFVVIKVLVFLGEIVLRRFGCLYGCYRNFVLECVYFWRFRRCFIYLFFLDFELVLGINMRKENFRGKYWELFERFVGVEKEVVFLRWFCGDEYLVCGIVIYKSLEIRGFSRFIKYCLIYYCVLGFVFLVLVI